MLGDEQGHREPRGRYLVEYLEPFPQAPATSDAAPGMDDRCTLLKSGSVPKSVSL